MLLTNPPRSSYRSRNRTPFRTAILISAAALAITLLTAGCGHTNPPPTPTRVQPTKTFPRTNLRPITGLPTIGPVSPNGITADQVRSYASHHPVRHSLDRKVPTVIDVVKMTAGELSRQLNGENFGVPAATTLFVAELSGHLVFPSPPGAEDSTYRLGIEVFDARTGNLLATGGLNKNLTASSRRD